MRYPMSTNMTGCMFFHKYLHPCALDKSGLSIGRVKELGTRIEINLVRGQNRLAIWEIFF